MQPLLSLCWRMCHHMWVATMTRTYRWPSPSCTLINTSMLVTCSQAQFLKSSGCTSQTLRWPSCPWNQICTRPLVSSYEGAPKIIARLPCVAHAYKWAMGTSACFMVATPLLRQGMSGQEVQVNPRGPPAGGCACWRPKAPCHGHASYPSTAAGCWRRSVPPTSREQEAV